MPEQAVNTAARDRRSVAKCAKIFNLAVALMRPRECGARVGGLSRSTAPSALPIMGVCGLGWLGPVIPPGRGQQKTAFVSGVVRSFPESYLRSRQIKTVKHEAKKSASKVMHSCFLSNKKQPAIGVV